MNETVEELLHEEGLIEGRIEDAAIRGDVALWIRLTMRKDAIPRLLAEVRAQPIREEVEQLEAELADLERQRQRALAEEPEVPAAMRSGVTPTMVRQRKLSGITSLSSQVGKDLDLRRTELENLTRKGAVRRHEKQLASLEAAGPGPV